MYFKEIYFRCFSFRYKQSIEYLHNEKKFFSTSCVIFHTQRGVYDLLNIYGGAF